MVSFYYTLNTAQTQSQAINTQIHTHVIPKMPFACSLIICETLWVSVKAFHGSTGTDAFSSLCKWFYKQFTEAWCLLTWNPNHYPSHYHWCNLFSGSCSTDQWFSWLNLLPRLKMCSDATLVLTSFRRGHCSNPWGNSSIRKIQIKAQVLCDSSFLQIFLVLAEWILRGLSRLRLVHRANMGQLLVLLAKKQTSTKI